jgi:hypothetical protein
MSFKVIDGGGQDKEERERQQKEHDRQRDREWAQSDFSWAIRDCAANMLRIIRGAGKPHELMRQMQKALNASEKFREVHGYWPQDVIANALCLEDEFEKHRARVHEGTLDQGALDRWWKDGTFERMTAEHTIYRGALQIVASQLIGQSTQQAAGDRELHDGLRNYERAREDQRERRRQETRASRVTTTKKRKRDDATTIDATPTHAAAKEAAGEPPVFGRAGQGRRTQNFGHDDLKELRKAIKAKDSKKIAELTSKIGQPRLDD